MTMSKEKLVLVLRNKKTEQGLCVQRARKGATMVQLNSSIACRGRCWHRTLDDFIHARAQLGLTERCPLVS